ncbi:MAG: DUF3592 domain-containing protein [Bacilli bacterium]|nr:DUF3592 domain-containing protein [Bacilli bacterium]
MEQAQKIIMVIVSIIFIGVGSFVMIREKNDVKVCTEEAVGTVIEIVEEEDISDDTISYTYYPVIEYEVDGNKISGKSTTGSGNSKYQVNDKVDILYDPNKPSHYIIKGDKTGSIIGIVFIVFGIGFFIYSIVNLLKKDSVIVE